MCHGKMWSALKSVYHEDLHCDLISLRFLKPCQTIDPCRQRRNERTGSRVVLRLAGALTQLALISDSCPVKVCRHMLSRMSHSFAEASQAPETKVRRSGDRDRLMTSPLWPENTVVCWLVSMSHSALGTKSKRVCQQRAAPEDMFALQVHGFDSSDSPGGVSWTCDDLIVINKTATGKVTWGYGEKRVSSLQFFHLSR